ncbi:hypothetical protein [Paracidovorax wautersii]|uniref:hypothetical protein n=1 Tax=Paracidovorax wautersii TaxID=1177982 RepID=UPI0031D001E6
MFTPEGLAFDEDHAVQAVLNFLDAVAWLSSSEMREGEEEDFRFAMREHLDILDTLISHASALQESLDEVVADFEDQLEDEELSTDERSDLKSRLGGARRKAKAAAKKVVAYAEELKGFEADRRAFVVDYLNHRIHGRKNPVNRARVDGLIWP